LKETEFVVFIISTFEHSMLLELVISAIEAGGIAKGNIFAAPLESKQQQAHILDTIHRFDGISQIDAALLVGAFSSVLFTVFGSIWPGGPLLWGLFGLLAGGATGLAIDTLHTKRKRGKKEAPNSGEVVVIVKCEKCQAAFVEQILTDHNAIGIALSK
jgi:hypothetical protein